MLDPDKYEPFYFLAKSVGEYVRFMENNICTFADIIIEKLDAARTIQKQETSDMDLIGFYIHIIRRALKYVSKKYKWKGTWSTHGLNIILLTQRINKFVHEWGIPVRTPVQWRGLYA